MKRTIKYVYVFELDKESIGGFKLIALNICDKYLIYFVFGVIVFGIVIQ